MTPNFQSEANQSSGSWNLQNDSRNGFSLNQATSREIGAIPNPTNFQQIDHKVSNPSNNFANSTNNIMFNQSMGNATENNLSSNAFSLFDSSAATLLSQNLSELNIRDDRPRPTKIRRRNALTILDQHFPNPNSMKNGNSSIIDAPTKNVDAFQGASLIQSLSDESIEQSGSYSAADWQHPKRKVPSAYSSSSGTTMSSYHRQKMHQRRQRKLQEKIDSLNQDEISHISLHEDLNNFKPKGHDILPEKIFEQLKQTQCERTMQPTPAESSANSCNALVLYRPPGTLLYDISRSFSRKGNDSNNAENCNSSLSTIPNVTFDVTPSIQEPCIEVEMADQE